MSKEWFRRTNWTLTDQEEFFTRLGRSRGQFQKAQYLRIQATYLENKYPSVSLELLRLVVSEFPEPSQLAQTYLQMAHCHLRLTELDLAIQCFRKALAQEADLPSVLTQAYLDFPVFVVASNRIDLFPEVDCILGDHASQLTFPADHYKYHMCRAIIADHNGDGVAASQHASAALSAAAQQHSGFRYHPKVGLVKKQDKTIQKKLVALAVAQQSAPADMDKPRR